MVTPTGGGDRTRGVLRFGEPMAAHSSWHAGGPAARFYIPVDADDLASFLRDLPVEEPVIWVGLGSNLLVRDGGIDGTVIMVAGALAGLACVGETGIYAEAGVACAKLARLGVESGLSGAEFMAGIPGTVGGALAMNAGAFGGETWRIVEQVETMDRSGNRHCRRPGEFDVGYRSVKAPGRDAEWFLSAQFRLQPGDPAEMRERIRGLLAERSRQQPTGAFSCGSVFRNPPGDHAGRLIEECGLKGRAIGSARVSTKHANFIINEGGARADQIEDLILLVRSTVLERCGIDLEPEVRIVGDRAGGEAGVRK